MNSSNQTHEPSNSISSSQLKKGDESSHHSGSVVGDPRKESRPNNGQPLSSSNSIIAANGPNSQVNKNNNIRQDSFSRI